MLSGTVFFLSDCKTDNKVELFENGGIVMSMENKMAKILRIFSNVMAVVGILAAAISFGSAKVNESSNAPEILFATFIVIVKS